MPKSPNGPVRRGQLIAPFGVGALVVVPGGTSLIIGGLDYWFASKDNKRSVDIEEYKITEWRLQRLLGVNHFRLPPDFRETFRNQGLVNIGLTIPAFRFPTWHFCPHCRLLRSFPMTASGKRGKLKCPECENKKKTRYMFQVPIIAMCENGHVQDFPWREWVHHHHNPVCQGTLRLVSTGSASLAGQKVKCDANEGGCGKERTLTGITSANELSTTLSKTLSEDGELFLCQGKRTWLGEDIEEKCNSNLHGSQRSASNLYFAQVISSIYLPINEDKNLQQLENLMQEPPISTFINTLIDISDVSIEKLVKGLRRNHTRLLVGFSDFQIQTILENKLSQSNQNSSELAPILDEDQRTAFRRAEYTVLRSERNDEFLRIKSGNLDEYDQDMKKYFSKLMLISKLRETRVLSGFTRVNPENNQDREQRQSLFWKEMPPLSERWLPAYIVFGEGIFFEFNEERLKEWESRKDVVDRVSSLVRRNTEIQEERHQRGHEVNPRFILIHSFAHIAMNRLTFECGYSSAALRERIYVSTNPDAPMMGVLIYTADGDSEGTMGGLVRMGKPGSIEPVIWRSVENAKWCSSDPVCMELGNSRGQGPDSSNLAACHNCALVPETACEEFNRFLDRGTLIGSLEDPLMGYFSI